MFGPSQAPPFYIDSDGGISCADPPYQVLTPMKFSPVIVYRDAVFPSGIKLPVAKGASWIGMAGPVTSRQVLPITASTRHLERDIAASPLLPPGSNVSACAQIIQDRIRAALLWKGATGVDFAGKGMSYLNTPLYRVRVGAMLLVFAVLGIARAFRSPAVANATLGVSLVVIVAVYAYWRHQKAKRTASPSVR